MSGGTRGSKLFDTLPFLVNTKIFRKRRRRARNKKMMILKRKQPESYKAKNDKRKTR
jgi:hypothetical protein